jgi:tight adherence protein B
VTALAAVAACALVLGGLLALRTRQARSRWHRVFRPPDHPHATVALMDRLRRVPRHRFAWLYAILAAIGLGAIAGGPVAAVVLGSYGAVGVVLLRRRRTAAQYARDRIAAIDAVSALAAELRAGLPAPTGVRPAGGPGAIAVLARLTSAMTLAEATGAPLADVLDRLDTHLRAMDRARRTAQAQAAGARASAALLAVLPVAGVGLGYLVGIDPTRVLLHTPLGAACLVGAVLLQLAGLAWAEKISRVEVPT